MFSGLPAIVLRVLSTIPCFADDDGSNIGSLRLVDTDGDGMILQEELYMVRSLSNHSDRHNSIFQDNTNIVSFNEFRFFTNLNNINSSHFTNCVNLKEIELPVGITAIRDSVFSQCSFLEQIVIPEGYQSIGSNMCNGCTSIKLVDIPSSTNSIGRGLIWGVNNQVTVICRAVTPPAFSTLNANPLVLYVPDESLSVYQSASGWSQYAKYMKPLSEYTG